MEIQGPTPNATQGLLTIIVPSKSPNNALFSLGLGIMWHWGGCPQIRMNSVAGTQKKQIPNHWGTSERNLWGSPKPMAEIAWELVDSAGLSASTRWGKKSGKLPSWGWVCVCVSNHLEGLCLHHPRCRKSEPSNMLQVKVWNHYLIETSIDVWGSCTLPWHCWGPTTLARTIGPVGKTIQSRNSRPLHESMSTSSTLSFGHFWGYKNILE